MNSNEIALALGPCADYEFDLVELHEGSLEPGRAGTVRHHMVQCARCSAYAAALDELDAALAAALPRPALSPGFDARLREQIAVLTQVPNRTAALATAEREHEWMLQNLGHGLGWRTVLHAAALASVVGGLIVGLDSVAPGLLQSFGLGPDAGDECLRFRCALAVAAGGLLFQQLSVQHDRTQRVPYLVGHVRRQLREGCQALAALLAFADLGLQGQFSS